MLKAVHGQYAQRVNRMKDRNGHLWQGRYFSSPLDSNYLMNAVRYVELNPVRAGLIETAENYVWSSAAAHCGIGIDPVVDKRPRSMVFAGIPNWSQWLRECLADETLTEIRRNGSQNLPCGSEEFVQELERTVGRELRYRSRGGQTKVNVPFESK
jgi:putative transposase